MLVVVGSSVKGEYVVFDLVGTAGKCSVMNSTDSFPFALQTLLTSSLNLSTLLLDFLPLSQQLNKSFSYTSFPTTVSVMHTVALGIFSPFVLSPFIPHPALNRLHHPLSLPLLLCH